MRTSLRTRTTSLTTATTAIASVATAATSVATAATSVATAATSVAATATTLRSALISASDSIEASTINGGGFEKLGSLRSLNLLVLDLDWSNSGLLHWLGRLESLLIVVSKCCEHSLSLCHSNYRKKG